MFIPMPMPTQYNDVQDYYPPLSSQSRSSSPSLRSPPRSPSSSIPSASLSSLGAGRRDSHAYPYRAPDAPPAPPTSIPLDDNFDAPTTEVPTEWALRSQPDGHPEYDESVTGYQNYVLEMERMLAGQMESAARSQECVREAYKQRDQEQQQHQAQVHSRRTSTSPSALRRIDTSLAESVRSSSRAGGGRRGLGSRAYANAPLSPPPPPPENARQVSGKKGRLELVEQRVLEDSATRTISLWRERVAASSAGSNVGDVKDDRSEAGSHMHRRVPSAGSVNGDPRLRRVVSDHARYASSVQDGRSRSGSVRGNEKGKAGKASYERSEYLVSYHSTKASLPKELFSPRSETGSALPGRELRTPSSPTTNRTYFEKQPASPTLRRHTARKSLERNEVNSGSDAETFLTEKKPCLQYIMSYPQTPPLTGSQASSGSPSGKQGPTSPPPVRSPLHGSFRDTREALSPVAGSERSLVKATRTSSVEAILASCDPSLLHIAPALEELGIKRVDHLRAIARLSEETRDREVKEQALKRGVTVVEWAIFLDKLQTL
ncbi:hypothetical protein BN946_scf184884.g23 [Trametes cinnabarina]|uniref:Uncharacterized protein n=1 Tax=Pycnoporus cinnabarinus TaxID=5643 RepID=A0A060SC69_PYCCI|nr:hypothetical protein BN946_scf184884.g23 [Trametes cinnabarina]